MSWESPPFAPSSACYCVSAACQRARLGICSRARRSVTIPSSMIASSARVDRRRLFARSCGDIVDEGRAALVLGLRHDCFVRGLVKARTLSRCQANVTARTNPGGVKPVSLDPLNHPSVTPTSQAENSASRKTLEIDACCIIDCSSPAAWTAPLGARTEETDLLCELCDSKCGCDSIL